MQWCVTTAEECENMISCLCNHITGEDYALECEDDTIATFTFNFFNKANYSRITRKLTIRLVYALHTNTYVWQAYKMSTTCRHEQHFVDRNNMIAELIVLLNRLGFSTPPQMW